MFGSNGPCPPEEEFFLPCGLLEPMYYDCDQQYQQYQQMTSPPECHSSPPQTPDVISGLMSMAAPLSSPSDMSAGSYGDMTSPEDHQQSLSPPSYYPGSLDVPSVKATRSKLIKEGLKLTIQSRRIVHGLDTVRTEFREPASEELTPEDQERRRRRRERNKVAATKCRNKKKERTKRLAVESESLEVNNSALRKEIHSLEREKKELAALLHGHIQNCGLPSRASYAHAHTGATWPSPVIG